MSFKDNTLHPRSRSAINGTLPCPSQMTANPIHSQTKKTSPFAARLQELGITLALDANPKAFRNNFFDASVEFNAKAEAVGRIHAKFRVLLNAFQNPSIQNPVLLEHLKRTASKELLSELKKNLAMIHTEKADSIFEINPRVILQIKDQNGRNLLEKYQDHLSKKLENLRDARTLNYIQHLVMEIESTSSPSDKKKLMIELNAEFAKLSLKSRENIVQFLAKHLGGPPNAILNLIKVRPQILVQCHSKSNALDHRIKKCELNAHLSFHFLGAYQLAEGIVYGDSSETARDVQKIHQLQGFYLQLLKPASEGQKKVISKRFAQLDPEIKTALGRALWVACYQPEMPCFADHLIRENPYLILDCKSKDGRDVIVQLMDHYKSRMTLDRFIPLFDQFKAQFHETEGKEALLAAFNDLPDFAKSDLCELLWLEKGGRKERNFGYFGYGGSQIKKNPALLKQGKPCILDQYSELLKQRVTFNILLGVNRYQEEMTLPNGPVDTGIAQIADLELQKEIPEGMRIAMVAAEFAGVINMGGLAPAVEGMARAYGVGKTRIILPKYDVINPAIELVEMPKYQVELNDTVYKVFKAKVNGFKCYFIEDEVFNVGKDEKGKPNNIYIGGKKSKNPDAEEKRRWAHFMSHAADLAYQFSKKEKNPVELVHVHDAQTALIPKIMKARHFEEWKEGLTPATVFTFHNNNSPLHYNYHEAQECLREIGLPYASLSSLVEGLEHADMNTTVSETFAQETQGEIHGKGMQRYVRINGFKGKLVGIVNGNTNGWNPQTDPQLKNWTAIDGKVLDLTYGPEDKDLPQKIQMIRQQLAEYLKFHGLADIDPKKPIFFYVGRYDAYQKGIDKLPFIMNEALECGAQFICIGLEPDERADAALQQMEEFAKSTNNQGVCIIRDYKRPDGRLHWQQGNKSLEDVSGVQGFGSVLRAAIDIGIFPSIFEPCGLVQGELHRMGVETAATATGGFVDTIFTDGPNRNGFLFERMPNWYSKEQDHAIAETIREATVKTTERLEALYSGDPADAEKSVEQKRKIMRNAANSSWESTFDGSLSPIERIKRAYGKGMRHRIELRGVIPMDLYGLKL